MSKEDPQNKLGTSTPVKLFEADDAELDELSKRTGIGKQTLIRLCVRAGVELMVKNGYQITLPLRFNSTVPAQDDSLLTAQVKRRGRQ